jgi:hypothetical protein
MAFLTIFTAPKPFTNPHIAVIQRNAILSWLNLGPEVEVVMIGEEDGLDEFAEKHQIKHIPQVRRNDQNTPLVSSIFELARETGSGEYLGYVNADIILLPDFVESVRQTAGQKEAFLMVGQRWDLEITEPFDFSGDWAERMEQLRIKDSKLHTQGGSDYFVYPRNCFQEMPEFAIGRAGWDNWMFYEARQRGWPLVNATASAHIIHQNHDYSHLPKGQVHYRLPETFENVRLAGGKLHIFTLLDVDYILAQGQVKPVKKNWRKICREIEISPLVRWHSENLAKLFFAVFHPAKAYQEVKVWLVRKLKKAKE